MCAYVALFGNIEVLKWAHGKGCPVTDFTWALANGCPLGDITRMAVENKSSHVESASGHVEVLKWLRAINCPQDTIDSPFL
jgi:hypothetical protein